MESEELFTSPSPSVCSSRILYTPSPFARSSLLHLQEVGSLRAISPHTSSRENLISYLCFVVTSGFGKLVYNKKEYRLSAGDVVFIDCRKPYSHSTGYGERDNNNNLWSLQWCHLYGPCLAAIYEKYQERGGQPVFHLKDTAEITALLNELYQLASSSEYIRDMYINEKLGSLLRILMSYSWNSENIVLSHKRMELNNIKEYLDRHYTEKVTLNQLSDSFYIDKYYLSRIFKEIYGIPIMAYIDQKRISKAKSMLRFTNMTIEEIAYTVGMNSANYFSRRFKKVEGIAPVEYRKMWQFKE